MDLSVILSAGERDALERTGVALEALEAELIVASSPGYGGLNEAAGRATRGALLFLEAGATIAPAAAARLLALLDEGAALAVPVLCDRARRIVSAGSTVRATRMGPFAFEIEPCAAGAAYAPRAEIAEVAAASASGFAITRSRFIELGGFAAEHADALGDVELSLRARERGGRLLCAFDAPVELGARRAPLDDPLRITAARARLDAAWRARIAPPPTSLELHETHVGPERYLDLPAPRPPLTVFVHGEVADGAALGAALADPGLPVAKVIWNSPSQPPPLNAPVVLERGETTRAAGAAMELRGRRAVAFVDAAQRLRPGWLAALARELNWGSDVVAATFVVQPPATLVVPTAGAHASLVALSDIPQHLRLDERLDLDDALRELTAKLRPCGLAVRAVESSPYTDRGRDPATLALTREAPALRADGLASIVMLSWNAPDYTRIALESIRQHTRHPHEVIIVDNGSGPETTNWLRTLDDARVIFNASNRGFAGGNNQGIAAARGEYIVLLNNDVVVTEGWLEDLIDALRRNPLTGVSAPRSNRVAGSQQVPDATYPDVASMHRFAAERRVQFRKTGYYLDRAIGFALCIDRRVIDEVGGIDERFGAGNFEDDDFCIRVRAAGYKIYVCDDVFIHHFGSVSFTSNKVDWQASMQTNWLKFARKWGLPDAYPTRGYVPGPVIARGFDRAAHFVALPSGAAATPVEPAAPAEIAEAAPAAPVVRRAARVRFAALVRNEDDWSTIGAFARRFARAFDLEATVTLEIAACGEVSAATLGERVLRLLERNGLDPEAVAEIGIDDVGDVDAWLDELAPATLLRVQAGAFGGKFDVLEVVTETSPAGLRRVLARLQAPA